MTNTELLRKRIDDSGLKYQYVAEKLGLSRFGLMNKINNVSEFKTSEVEKLCVLLQINTLTERNKIFFAKTVDL